MRVIDADAHVIENESTWDYMLESERQFKPKVVAATSAKDPFDYWLVDGRIIPRSNVGRDLPVTAREMSDLGVRIKHMAADVRIFRQAPRRQIGRFNKFQVFLFGARGRRQKELNPPLFVGSQPSAVARMVICRSVSIPTSLPSLLIGMRQETPQPQCH